jgi:predicted enzyme related to lactoylglutathione lyase
MTEMSSYTPGTFCWIELGTTDTKAGKQFYTGLFGWEVNEIPIGPDQIYTMFQIDGKDVAAMYQQDIEQQSQGIPPHWLSYISVANVDEMAREVQSLGGQLLTEPFDVFQVGRMAPVQDPQGAAFALWQPGQHIGARLVNQPGTLCWNELATTDAAKAREFYTGLFDWQAEVVEVSSGPYTLFLNGDRQNGGMWQMSEEWGNMMPPHWMAYFAVEDCERSVQKVTELGGEILIGPLEAGDIGRFATVQDPQGAVFSIIKPNNPA